MTKQTYRIPPRTTVAGMLAAIVGADRDSYYDTFGADNAAIAITPLTDFRTVNIPTTGLGTDPKQDMTTTVGDRWGYKVTYQDTTGDRQLHAYEVLADPAYRIDVALEDEDFYTDLREHLVNGTSVYPPSLGKSEHLAVIEDVETDREPTAASADRTYDIDSIAPISLADAIPQGGVTYGVERSPAIMERDGGGRRTTRFDDYVYTQQSEKTVRLSADTDLHPVNVGDRTVVFR